MNGGYFSDAGMFLIDTVFDIYILLVLLRFLFQLSRVDYYNPVSLFIVKVTNPPLRPLRRFIPGFFGADIAALVLALILGFIKLFLKSMLVGVGVNPMALVVLSLAEMLKVIVYIYLFTVFARAISSWFNPNPSHPLVRLLIDLTETADAIRKATAAAVRWIGPFTHRNIYRTDTGVETRGPTTVRPRRSTTPLTRRR